MDDADRLNCSDVVCARGDHNACHDLPPPKPQCVAALPDHDGDVTMTAVEVGGRSAGEVPLCAAHGAPDSVEVSEG